MVKLEYFLIITFNPWQIYPRRHSVSKCSEYLLNICRQTNLGDLKKHKERQFLYLSIEIHFSIKTTKFLFNYTLLCFQICISTYKFVLDPLY